MLFPIVGSRPSSARIANSVRFNPADSPDFNRTVSVAGNRKIFTLSWWMKITDFGTLRPIFHSHISGGAYFGINLTSGNQFEVTDGSAFTTTYPNVVLRDPTAHLHCVLAVNTNNANATKFRLYVNNIELTSGGTYPGAIDLSWNHNGGSTLAMYIGRAYTGTERFGGYLSCIHHIDGQQLTPASFGEVAATTGVWSPKGYSGTYGTNGFYLDFSDDTLATSSALGKDRSGNNNDWTPTNISVGTSGFDVDRDVCTDTPTNYGDGGNGRGNYCTLNPIDSSEGLGSPTLKNGALEHHYQSAGWQDVRGTLAVSSGKWYWEVTVAAPGSGGSFTVGIREAFGKSLGGVWWHNASVSEAVNGKAYGYKDDGLKVQAGSNSAYGATFTTGDVIGVALDLDAGTLVFYKNGVSQGTAFTGVTGEFTPGLDLNLNAHAKCNFGQRAFKHTPPANHLALHTGNLPTPAITRPSTAVDVVTFAGTGASLPITSLGFSPDLVWVKQRSTPADGHNVFDTTRGATIELVTNSTSAEATVAQSLTAFSSNGFTLGTDGGVNENTLSYVAWCWDESVASGLDIRAYTGNGAAQTITHNLGVVPAMIIVKARATATNQDWFVYHKNLATPQSNRLFLNGTNAAPGGSSAWNSTAPTTANFTAGTDISQNTINYIAYVFAEVAGFSRIGRYTGDGTANGPFVYCGFRPRFIMIKEATGSNASVASWVMFDTARDASNPTEVRLFANLSDAESSDSAIGVDILATGFKPRVSNFNINESGGFYVFAAFAEAPAKFSRAR